MGSQKVIEAQGGDALRKFSRALLRDLHALEQLIRDGRIESGVHRIGAEQELFLVDHAWNPAPIANAVLGRIAENCFTPELGRHQVEINAEPMKLESRCLSEMHAQLEERIARLRATAEGMGARALMVGILPTLRLADLCERSFAPFRRYAALDHAIRKLRGEAYPYRIVGTDELLLKANTTIFESANCSFQVHLQIDPDNFAAFYNAAQAATGPLLAIGANSPLLLGKRLWSETRIALFQQAADTRAVDFDLPREDARVTFGRRWVTRSPLEVFREDLSRFPPLLVNTTDDDALECLARGDVPELAALRTQVGTVYRWNRVCYGVVNGVPHLRIENRVLPAGPTLLDQMANAAFWLGMLFGLVGEVGDVSRKMDFDDAKTNFLAAARLGLDTRLAWLSGERLAAPELITKKLVPLARAGLRSQGLADEDIERYMGVIEARAATGRTGARWALDSFAATGASGACRGERLAAVTAAMAEREASGQAVHTWALADVTEAGEGIIEAMLVEQAMDSEVVTVRDDMSLAWALAVMEWHSVSELPVEDEHGELAGMVRREAALAAANGDPEAKRVREAMESAPATVSPGRALSEVLTELAARGISSALVVRAGRLAGVLRADRASGRATLTPPPTADVTAPRAIAPVGGGGYPASTPSRRRDAR